MIFSFIVICLLPDNLAALDFQIFPFDKQLTEYIQEYHKNPNPQEAFDRFFDLDIENFEKKAEETDQPHSRAILMAFFTNVLGENPDLVLPFANRLIKESTGDQASFGIEIIAHGATENRKEALALIVERYDLPAAHVSTLEALEVLPYPGMIATNWQLLDILWACYFATAEDSYIEKIAEPLEYWQIPDEKFKEKLRYFSKINPEPGTEEYKELYGILTAQASMFGLTLNSLKSPRVLEALIKISEKRQDKVGNLVKKITIQAKNKLAKQPPKK